MDEITIYIDDERITVTGEYIKGQHQTWDDPGFDDEFHVYEVSDPRYTPEYIEENHMDDIWESFRYEIDENYVEVMING